jgi:hypothetical protein
MPPPPANEISPQEKAVFQKWRADGLQETGQCRDGSSGAAYTLDENYIRSNILEDLRSQQDINRADSRYLVASHQFNETLGQYPESLVINSLNKGVNSISLSEDIRKLGPIDSKQTIFRIDLEAFGRTKGDWELITAADPFQIVDNTTDGQLIRALTRSNQPWLHADNFLNTALSPQIYNKLMRIPANANLFYKILGVDRVQQYRDKEVRFVGFSDSPISNTNRRLIRYNTSDNGFLWVSNDTDDNDLPGVLQANLFGFPLSPDTGGSVQFAHRAEEWIFELENGLIGFALYDFPNQLRQELAPVTIVRQNGPFDAEISNGRDCMRCHNKILAKQDQVRESSIQGDFAFDDLQRIKDFYQPQGVNNALFAKDNAEFSKALASLDIDVNGDDPVNALTDRHRQNFGIDQAAAFFFLTPEDFKERLRTSDVKSQIPQLLSGGSITLNDLIIATPDIIREFELFEDRD